MGVLNEKVESTEKMRESQTQVLSQAEKIRALELNLFMNSFEKREHHQVIARILIYGHRHLIDHIHNFEEKSRRKKFLQYLSQTDYETIDLLYQNLVYKKIKEKKKYRYGKFSFVEKKGKEENTIEQIGMKLIKQGKVAIMIFAGGSSSRFLDKQQKIRHKAFYTEKKEQQSLMEIMMKKVEAACKLYGNIETYIIYNDYHSTQLSSELKWFNHLSITKLKQPTMSMVNLSGKLCLQNENNYDMISAPSGCGDFIKISVKDKKLLDILTEKGFEYIFCSGIQNILETVIDPYLLGLLATHRDNLGSVFKCTYPENENQNLSRVVFNETLNKVQVDEFEVLEKQCDQQSLAILKRSPVWMNSAVFHIERLKTSLEKAKNLVEENKEAINFTAKKRKATYWNPTQKIENINEYCYVFERELSDVLVNQTIKSVGVMVERETQFLPVISIDQEHIWGDAYKYFKLKKKQKVRYQHESLVSKMNFDQEKLSEF